MAAPRQPRKPRSPRKPAKPRRPKAEAPKADRRPLGADPSGNGAAPGVEVELAPPTTKLGKQLYEFVSSLSVAVMLAGDQHCADVLARNASPLAHAWDGLAQKNARVRLILETMVTGGAWGEAVFATLAVAVPIAQHHNIYPPEWPNPWRLIPPSPEVMSAAEQERAAAEAVERAVEEELRGDGDDAGEPDARP